MELFKGELKRLTGGALDADLFLGMQLGGAKENVDAVGELATSRILEVYGERMIKRTFDPGFRIALHQKDLNLALQGAKALGVSLPNTATAQELFNAIAANGGSVWDNSALVRALEMLSNHEIAGPRRNQAA